MDAFHSKLGLPKPTFTSKTMVPVPKSLTSCICTPNQGTSHCPGKTPFLVFRLSHPLKEKKHYQPSPGPTVMPHHQPVLPLPTFLSKSPQLAYPIRSRHVRDSTQHPHLTKSCPSNLLKLHVASSPLIPRHRLLEPSQINKSPTRR